MAILAAQTIVTLAPIGTDYYLSQLYSEFKTKLGLQMVLTTKPLSDLLQEIKVSNRCTPTCVQALDDAF